MSTAGIEVVDAFTAIGVAPDKAMAAAAALNKQDALVDVQGVKADVAVVKWMAGFNLGLSLLILGKLFIH